MQYCGYLLTLLWLKYYVYGWLLQYWYRDELLWINFLVGLN